MRQHSVRRRDLTKVGWYLLLRIWGAQAGPFRRLYTWQRLLMRPALLLHRVTSLQGVIVPNRGKE
jgi:hypothetical protein